MTMYIKAIGTAIALSTAYAANAEDAGRWYIQAGPAGISFSESTSLSVAGTAVPGAGAKVSTEASLALGVGYFITNEISLIGLGGIPPTSEITGGGSIAGLRPGKIQYAPFVFAANYHFNKSGRFQPFVGAGATYTLILDEKSGDIENLKAKNAFGPVLRVGFDYMINDHWGLNFDVKKLFLEPKFDATLVGGTEVSGKAKLNPWLIGSGITYRF
jgi:outer membrane protein